jgi:hypothetical protein
LFCSFVGDVEDDAGWLAQLGVFSSGSHVCVQIAGPAALSDLEVYFIRCWQSQFLHSQHGLIDLFATMMDHLVIVIIVLQSLLDVIGT